MNATPALDSLRRGLANVQPALLRGHIDAWNIINLLASIPADKPTSRLTYRELRVQATIYPNTKASSQPHNSTDRKRQAVDPTKRLRKKGNICILQNTHSFIGDTKLNSARKSYLLSKTYVTARPAHLKARFIDGSRDWKLEPRLLARSLARAHACKSLGLSYSLDVQHGLSFGRLLERSHELSLCRPPRRRIIGRAKYKGYARRLITSAVITYFPSRRNAFCFPSEL